MSSLHNGSDMGSAAFASCSKLIESRASEKAASIGEKIDGVRKRIESATRDAKRTEESTPLRLVAISKLHPPSSILAAHVYLKQEHFGENYAQEMEAKARVLPKSIKWHFVGKLQSNKAKLVAGIDNLYVVETLDSVKLATALDKARANVSLESKQRLGVYVQINTSGEANKGGLEPLSRTVGDESVCGTEAYKLAVHVIQNCKHLQLRGVMTIGAAATSKANREQVERLRAQASESNDAEQLSDRARSMNPDFATLYETRQALVHAMRTHFAAQTKHDVDPVYQSLFRRDGDDATGGLELSMGMSNDLEVAIWSGSNNVRVGTDCFGVRPASREEAMETMKDELESQSSSSTQER